MTATAPPTHAVETHFTVRDYECDMDHVVNNAVYLNYLEHARHELLRRLGIHFGELSKRGVSLVVTRIEIDYKASLKSGDAFTVATSLHRKGRVRLAFHQEVVRQSDQRSMAFAVATCTALNASKRPEFPPELEAALSAVI